MQKTLSTAGCWAPMPVGKVLPALPSRWPPNFSKRRRKPSLTVHPKSPGFLSLLLALYWGLKEDNDPYSDSHFTGDLEEAPTLSGPVSTSIEQMRLEL